MENEKKTRLESADKIIISISEVLLRASGETIQATAERERND